MSIHDRPPDASEPGPPSLETVPDVVARVELLNRTVYRLRSYQAHFQSTGKHNAVLVESQEE
ncbi:hypothetical protein RB213_016275 [Colletotrichum asianum]